MASQAQLPSPSPRQLQAGDTILGGSSKSLNQSLIPSEDSSLATQSVVQIVVPLTTNDPRPRNRNSVSNSSTVSGASIANSDEATTTTTTSSYCDPPICFTTGNSNTASTATSRGEMTCDELISLEIDVRQHASHSSNSTNTTPSGKSTKNQHRSLLSPLSSAKLKRVKFDPTLEFSDRFMEGELKERREHSEETMKLLRALHSLGVDRPESTTESEDDEDVSDRCGFFEACGSVFGSYRN